MNFRSLSVLLCAATSLTSAAQAGTVGYWRFEDKAFLEDSSGNGNTLMVNAQQSAPPQVIQYALPNTGVASAFPKHIDGGANTSAVIGTGQNNGFRRCQLSADISHNGGGLDGLARELTIEAFINLSHSSESSSSVIAGQGILAPDGAAWGLIITSQNSTVGAQKLVFQFNKNGGAWNQGLAMVDTNVVIELNKDYYIAVSADFSDLTAEGVTVYVKNLTDNTDLQVLGFTHSAQYTRIAATTAPLVIGCGANTNLPFYGVIDEVRLSDTKLPREALLISR